MANGIFNIARGKIAHFGGLPATNDAFVVVVLQAAQADDDLNNYANLSTLLAHASNTEWTATGYARDIHTDITPSVNNTTNTAKVVIDTDDTWNSVTGSAAVKLLVCYDNDTTAGTDADIIPLTYHDFVVTPNGGNITADYNQVDGIWGSS